MTKIHTTVVSPLVNGQKVTGQKVTKLLGQKVTIYIFYPGEPNLYFCLTLMYVGRTRSHNIYIP